ncbi:MAG: GWxTD domain-containing protein [Calditrichia bacterium]
MKQLFRAVLLVGLFFSLSTMGQNAYKETYEKSFLKSKYPQVIPVTFRAYPKHLSADTFRVYLMANIRHSFLQFLHEGGTFRAEAEVEVTFKGGPDQVNHKIWRVSIDTDSYSKANSRNRYLLTVDSLDLPAASYTIQFKERDLNGQQRIAYRQKLTLETPSTLASSPPLLYYPAKENKTAIPGVTAQPSPLRGNWHFNKDMGLYLSAAVLEGDANIQTVVRVKDNESGEMVFKNDTTTTAKAQLHIVLPKEKLREKTYRIEIVHSTADDSVKHILPVNIVWFNKPLSRWSPELATRPLKYIIDKETFKGLIKGNGDKKLANVRSFWDERDPTANTPFNELELEFYTRVDSTLKLFSNRGRLGWETDLGKIYISNGPPAEILDRSLAPIPTPYLRWTYFDEKQGKRFDYLFRALDGRKEYELAETTESDL